VERPRALQHKLVVIRSGARRSIRHSFGAAPNKDNAMKLRVPDDCGAVSHRGHSLQIGADRSIEVDDDDWEILLTHRFRPWSGGPAVADLPPLSRDELVKQVMNPTLRTLQASAAEHVRAKPLAPEETLLPCDGKIGARSKAPSDVGIEAISELKRPELFALLRSKSVSVSLPVTNEKLRALARRALG
jgi:hypothetical protein